MRILLVDPSLDVLDAVTALLEAAHHEVRAFADEHAALRCLAQDPRIDAMLTSVELGSMSGLEMCHRARRVAGARRPLYIIVMSDDGARQKLVEALDSGADDFIGMPPALDELYARLRTGERLVGMQRDLIQLASLDSLTGAFNRRAFFLASEEICRTATATGEPVAAIMLDVDHFKSINDTYGHDTGDAALKTISAEIAHVDDAVFGRLGGEEFGLIVDQCGIEEALGIAEGLRSVIAGIAFPGPHGPIHITCSFGIAAFVPGESVDALLKRADLALYDAKRLGRARVIVFQGDDRRPRTGSVTRGKIPAGERAAE